MYKKDNSIRDKFFSGKGVCLSHMANLLEGADSHLSPIEQENFYNRFLPMQTHHMERVYEDISWFIEKYDYNIGAVIGIMTFVVLAIVSLVTYRTTGSYKNEEGFQ